MELFLYLHAYSYSGLHIKIKKTFKKEKKKKFMYSMLTKYIFVIHFVQKKIVFKEKLLFSFTIYPKLIHK